MYRFLARLKAGPLDHEYLVFEDDDKNLTAVTPDWKFWFPVDYEERTPLIAVYTVQLKKGKPLETDLFRRAYDQASNSETREE